MCYFRLGIRAHLVEVLEYSHLTDLFKKNPSCDLIGILFYRTIFIPKFPCCIICALDAAEPRGSLSLPATRTHQFSLMASFIPIELTILSQELENR